MADKTPPKITLKAARVNAGLTAKEVGTIVTKQYQTILSYEKESEKITPGSQSKCSELIHYLFIIIDLF